MSETTQQLIDRLPTAIDITYRDGNGGISLSAIINELAARLKVAEDCVQHSIASLHEINTNNYDHEDVCQLNNASVDVCEYLLKSAPIFDLSKPFEQKGSA